MNGAGEVILAFAGDLCVFDIGIEHRLSELDAALRVAGQALRQEA